jgi:hypothetical protein
MYMYKQNKVLQLMIVFKFDLAPSYGVRTLIYHKMYTLKTVSLGRRTAMPSILQFINRLLHTFVTKDASQMYFINKLIKWVSQGVIWFYSRLFKKNYQYIYKYSSQRLLIYKSNKVDIQGIEVSTWFENCCLGDFQFRLFWAFFLQFGNLFFSISCRKIIATFCFSG